MQPSPRKDLIRANGRVRRPLTASRIVASLLFLGAGTATTMLAASDLWWWAAVAFGIVVLGTIAAFTLVEMEDVEFETALRARSDDAAAL